MTKNRTQLFHLNVPLRLVNLFLTYKLLESLSNLSEINHCQVYKLILESSSIN